MDDYESQFDERYFAERQPLCALCGEPWPHEKCGVNSMEIIIC